MRTACRWSWAVLALALPVISMAQVPVKPVAPKIAAPVIKLPPGSAASAVQAAPKTSAAALDRKRLFDALRRSQEQAARDAATREQIARQNAERERAQRDQVALGYTYRHAQGLDCDDTKPTVHRRASEVCDHIDNNCDGAVDEGQQLAFYLDSDGDGHGDPAQRLLACASDQQWAASAGRWLVLVGNDCNDADPSRWQGCTP